MDFMAENTAEVVERITTERETLRYQLEETKKLLERTQGEYETTLQYLDQVLDRVMCYNKVVTPRPKVI